MTVAGGGGITYGGKTGDGIAFAAGALLKSDGSFAIFVPLYPGAAPGSISGLGSFTVTPSVSDLNANLAWVKPAQTAGALYRAGFSANVGLIGSAYLPPSSGQVLQFTAPTAATAALALSGGGLPSPHQDTVSVTSQNVVTENAPAADKLTMTITAASGLFTGSFRAGSASTVKTAFAGVVFQKQNLGSGVFVGSTQSGLVELTPQ